MGLFLREVHSHYGFIVEISRSCSTLYTHKGNISALIFPVVNTDMKTQPERVLSSNMQPTYIYFVPGTFLLSLGFSMSQNLQRANKKKSERNDGVRKKGKKNQFCLMLLKSACSFQVCILCWITYTLTAFPPTLFISL